ncbi:MAG: hypothetical protein K0S79_1280 [Nitrospira sp.]|nr:hypothetical protein [Nitrospira sp.]
MRRTNARRSFFLMVRTFNSSATFQTVHEGRLPIQAYEIINESTMGALIIRRV